MYSYDYTACCLLVLFSFTWILCSRVQLSNQVEHKLIKYSNIYTTIYKKNKYIFCIGKLIMLILSIKYPTLIYMKNYIEGPYDMTLYLDIKAIRCSQSLQKKLKRERIVCGILSNSFTTRKIKFREGKNSW